MPLIVPTLANMTVYPESFGAVGDGVADDLAAIQAAETYLAGLVQTSANASSRPVLTMKPGSIYAITGKIMKQSNVDWDGPGLIRRRDYASPTGTRFPLVYAYNKSNFAIRNVQFQNLTHDQINALNLPRGTGTGDNGSTAGTGAGTFGNDNTAIELIKCNQVKVEGCTLVNFSFGIRYTFCTYFRFARNTLSSGNAVTLADMLAGTYVTYSTVPATNYGCIVENFQLPLLVGACASFGTICDNIILGNGLDVGITSVDQAYTQEPLLIFGNIIQGTNSAIQVYRGSVADPSDTAPTYQTATSVVDNLIYCTWEQGIYLRGANGIICSRNYIERAAQGGANGAPAGNSASSILTRVNPWTQATLFLSAIAGNVSPDHASTINENRVVNHGRDGIACDAAIQLRWRNITAENNSVVRENWVTPADTAILLDVGDDIINVDAVRNKIKGGWAIGIQISGAAKAKTSIYQTSYHLDFNEVEGAAIGIVADALAFNVRLYRNRLCGRSNGTIGLYLRNAPYSEISFNEVENFPIGIQLRSGNLASSVPRILNGGTIPQANSRGGTVVVRCNNVTGCATPFSVTETGTGDITFKGRTLLWEGDIVDKSLYDPDVYALGVPTVGTWSRGQQTRCSTMAVGVTPGAQCITNGHLAGVATTALGTATSGSPNIVLATLNDFDGYAPGIYITHPGFTGTVKIIGINLDTLTLTVDANATSTPGSPQAMTIATATFGKHAVLTA